MNKGIKNILANTALVLISVTLALAAGELALRLIAKNTPKNNRGAKGFFVSDPELIYRNNPGISTRLTKKEFDIAVDINSEGLRDYEHKDAGDGRSVILGVGDSFTFGEGADYEHSYLRQLESMIEKDGMRPVEVVKAGVSAYDTVAEDKYLTKLLPRYKPDLVILGFTTNDVVDIAGGGVERYGVTYDGHLYKKKSGAGELFARTRLGQLWYRKMQSPMVKLRKRFKPSFAHGDGWTWDFVDMYKKDQPAYIKKAWDAIGDSIVSMRDNTVAAGSEFMVVYIPIKDQFRDRTPDGYDYTLPEKKIVGICSKNGIRLYNPVADLRATGKPMGLYYDVDGHFRPEGYNALAKGMYEYLKYQGLLDKHRTKGISVMPSADPEGKV